MFSPSHLRSRRVFAALLALWLGGLGNAALAVERPAVASAASAPASPSTADAPAKSRPADRVSASPVRGPQDPMEMLRMRLEQKLGAAKSLDVSGPSVLRVVGRATTAGTSGADAASAPLRGLHRSAASGAASHHAAGDAHPSGTGTRPLDPSLWAYSGSGSPATWGRMSSAFAKCANGTRQSPIDIQDGIKLELDALRFDYKASAFRVIDNGHTVQVNVEPGNSIEVMGHRYELVQFDFHRPAEERIDGKQFDLGVHLVHRDAEGHVAMVAVLFDHGDAQPVVQSVWNNLPLEKGEEVAASRPLDPAGLLPAERGYFIYMGSLTTPPCSEGVLWMVMKKPITASAEQLDIFARLYPMNARPIQAASGRIIKESN